MMKTVVVQLPVYYKVKYLGVGLSARQSYCLRRYIYCAEECFFVTLPLKVRFIALSM